MLRIFLVIEDMNHLNSLKATLSKLGLVVETSVVDLGIKDHIMSFRPDVVVSSGTGRKVNPLLVAQKVKDVSRDIKVYLLVPQGAGGHRVSLQGAFVDGGIEYSGDPLDLLATLNPLLKGKSRVDLVDKYQKLTLTLPDDNRGLWVVGGGKGTADNDSSSPFSAQFATSRDSQERSQAYKDLTKEVKVDPQANLSKSKAKNAWDNVKEDFDKDKLSAIDEEKRRLVKELFRKK